MDDKHRDHIKRESFLLQIAEYGITEEELSVETKKTLRTIRRWSIDMNEESKLFVQNAIERILSKRNGDKQHMNTPTSWLNKIKQERMEIMQYAIQDYVRLFDLEVKQISITVDPINVESVKGNHVTGDKIFTLDASMQLEEKLASNDFNRPFFMKMDKYESRFSTKDNVSLTWKSELYPDNEKNPLGE